MAAKQKKTTHLISLFMFMVFLMPIASSAASGEWTWMNGDNETDEYGLYGTLGEAGEDNTPGSRYGGFTWTDNENKFWFFGGYGYNSYSYGYLNDLWTYNPSSNEWTWMGGPDEDYDVNGIYGIQGQPHPDNIPGSRYDGTSWIDKSGNLWLFGGYGYNYNTYGYLNDLWRYNPSLDEWTWMNGDNQTDTNGFYGTKGLPGQNNTPGARYEPISFTDSDGNLWLFGGHGIDGYGSYGNLNDLWRYDVPTNQWTWVDGDNASDASGIYGTQGVADDENVPGARFAAYSWTDNSGNFWLFGGDAYDSYDGSHYHNDLWRYNPVENQWTWIDGDNKTDTFAVYGTQGVPSSNNIPGSRAYGHKTSWTDNHGNLWLFGGWGWGYDNSTGSGENYLNDLWSYTPATNQWTWVSGDNEVNAVGEYGTKEVADPGNIPGGRWDSMSFSDASGDLWLFGGAINDGSDYDVWSNDLWKYELQECLINTDCDDGLFCTGDTICTEGVCESPGSPCAYTSAPFCDEDNDECVECLADTDCDDGLFCTGDAFCFDGLCEFSGPPCDNSTNEKFCDEESDTCVECLVNIDCDDGLFCTGNPACAEGVCGFESSPCDNNTNAPVCDEDNDECVECLDDSQCDDDSLYCTGDPICTARQCVFEPDPCSSNNNSTPICDEEADMCVECLANSDCDALYQCEDKICEPRCQLAIKYKAPTSEKLAKKDKKLKLTITGGTGFDPTAAVDAGTFDVIKRKPKVKKDKLTVKLLIPKDSKAQIIPIRVGDCLGEIEIM